VDVIRAAVTAMGRPDLETVAGPLPDEVASRDYPVGEVAEAIIVAFDAQSGRDEMSEAGLSKSVLSTAITPTVPAELTRFCKRCDANHVIDGLFAWLPCGRALSWFPERGPRPSPGSTDRLAWLGLCRCRRCDRSDL